MKSVFVFSASVLALAHVSPAIAQDVGAAASADIVVTAQKRSENVQNVPKSVAVVSQAKLTEAGSPICRTSVVSPRQFREQLLRRSVRQPFAGSRPSRSRLVS
jgi:hypothetical protein